MKIHVAYKNSTFQVIENVRMISHYSKEVVLHFHPILGEYKPQQNIPTRNVLCVTSIEPTL